MNKNKQNLGGLLLKETKTKEAKNEAMLLVPKNLYENHSISHYAIATYCLLQKLSVHTQLFKQCVSLQQLIYYLIDKVPDRRNRIYSYIEQGIEELHFNNHIQITGVQQKHFLLDCTNIWFDTDSGNFSKVSFDEVRKIFQIKGANNYCLLRYFIFLMGTLVAKITVTLPDGNSKSGIISNFPISYLAKQMDISTKTIMDYNKALEDAKLIYVYRQNDFVLDENNSLKTLSNIYGRYEDKEYIDVFAQNQRQYNKSHRHTDENYNNANQKRRLAQMYQHIRKGKYDDYSEDEIIAVYDYVLLENKKYEELYDKTQYDGYLDKTRDIDVFKQFDFIKEIM